MDKMFFTKTYANSDGTAGAAGRNHQPGAGECPTETSQTGSGADDHTSTAAPNSTANAHEAQEPEPPPEKAEPGRTPAGQGCPAAGHTTSTPPAPATADTMVAERAASAAGCCEAATNTCADGTAYRMAESKPAAQPTSTGQPATTDGSTDRPAETAKRQERLPEKPTTGKATGNETGAAAGAADKPRTERRHMAENQPGNTEAEHPHPAGTTTKIRETNETLPENYQHWPQKIPTKR